MLVDYVINALAEGDGTPSLINAIVDVCGYRTDETLGAILGGLDIEQITQMSEMLSWIQDGTMAITYNNETNTFSVQKAEQK